MKKMRICMIILGMLLVPTAVFAAETSGPAPPDEIILEDSEAGVHRYQSDTLAIEAIRRYDEEKRITWTVADIVSTGGDVFRVISTDPTKPLSSQPRRYVEDIASANGVVLALNSDYSFSRLASGRQRGVVIRGGIIHSNKRLVANPGKFPHLDLLALFADGDMKVYKNGETTGEELLAIGAVDVLAFGPILVSGGAINTEGIREFYPSREPRIGIGMVEKGHYKVIMVEGRHNLSQGINLEGFAQLFADEGCALAFNLDGGQSATLCFMGKQIILVGKMTNMSQSARRTNEIIGIGYSPQVQPD